MSSLNCEQELAYWRRLLEDLQVHMTIAQIAEHLKEEDRQVWRWKAGDSRPRGWSAIGLFLLHVKLCPNGQRQIGHVAEDAKQT